MSNELEPIYAPRDTVTEHGAEQKDSKEARRKHVRTAVISSLVTILVAVGIWGISKHEQEIGQSTEEISALVKQLGYISAEAYMPTKDDKAYITLRAPGCTPGDPGIVLNNVTAKLVATPVGTEIASFRVQTGEEEVDGSWLPTRPEWKTLGDLCASPAVLATSSR